MIVTFPWTQLRGKAPKSIGKDENRVNGKIDHKKVLKVLYTAKSTPQIVDVQRMNFLMIDGSGSTEERLFQRSVEALFSVAYKTKFICKKELGFDYSVMPLEGLWWADDFNDFVLGQKERWKWTLMIMQPECVTDEVVKRAIQEAEKSKGNELVQKLRLESFQEGLAAQIMHIGPFSEEAKTVSTLHHFVNEHGGAFDGLKKKHHEIYLSDFRKVDPAKMKTIIRQPYVK